MVQGSWSCCAAMATRISIPSIACPQRTMRESSASSGSSHARWCGACALRFAPSTGCRPRSTRCSSRVSRCTSESRRNVNPKGKPGSVGSYGLTRHMATPSLCGRPRLVLERCRSAHLRRRPWQINQVKTIRINRGTNQVSRVSKSKTIPDGSSRARAARQHLSSRGKVRRARPFETRSAPGAPKAAADRRLFLVRPAWARSWHSRRRLRPRSATTTARHSLPSGRSRCKMNPLMPHRDLFERKAASYSARWPWLRISTGAAHASRVEADQIHQRCPHDEGNSGLPVTRPMCANKSSMSRAFSH